MRILVSILLLLLPISSLLAQDTMQARIVLVGDAGELTNGRHPVVSAVKSTVPFDEKTTIIFLGDNLYKQGLPDDALPNYNAIKAPLDSQIFIAKGSKAKVYFIPGNHDWNNGSKNGYEAILREQSYVDMVGGNNVAFYPKDGCPGPVEVNITPDIVLIIIDSQWWLHPYDKPGIESDCPFKTKDEVLTQLGDLLQKNFNKVVLLAMHHTMKSVGIHGGYFKLKQHIFPFTDAIKNLYIPLPVIGSIYPITRSIFGTSEDLRHPLYQSMISDITHVVKGHKNVIMVAGHEHSLELIQDSGYNYIVSGSGSKATRVYKNRRSPFQSDQHGFVTLEVSKSKTVDCDYYVVDSGKTTKAFTTKLMQVPSNPLVISDSAANRQVEYSFKDSVVISASDRYKKASAFKKLVLGSNYRKEWSTPVKLKVLNIRKEEGGFKLGQLGGGRQSRSIRLIDKLGREWVLRSVDKDPEKALPENLRGTLAQDIVQDLISASHPYAPLVVGSLARSANIVAPQPKFFFVPDDPAFGIYRSLFANTVCMLEQREPTPDTSDTKSTAKVMNKMMQDNDNRIDQKAFLKARMLDILVGDWDRHFDQWRWGVHEIKKGNLYYPIPRDRDQAFFNADGLLPDYLSKREFKYLQGFKSNIRSIKWFNWEERDLDRFFLNELTEEDWRNVIVSFQSAMSDDAIRSAVKQLPPEIYAEDSAMLINKLKSRRNVLLSEGMRYYRFISKTVRVPGSNKSEYFRIEPQGKKNVELDVYKINKGGDTTSLMYRRAFNFKVTKELRVFGLNGNDKFVIDTGVRSGTRVRLVGGKGNDTFKIAGNMRTTVYDNKAEKNQLTGSGRRKNEFSSDYLVNDYKPISFMYNTVSFPQINIGYNEEDKLFAGIGFSRRTYGFRKEPFETYQRLSTLYAFSHGAYQAKYQGVFNSVILKKDLLIDLDLVNPTLNNFFGYGNNSVNASDISAKFYRVRYKYFQSDILIRKRFNDVLHISFGPSYYHYWSRYKDNNNRILGKPEVLGFDSASIYEKKDYLGGKIKASINYINSEFFPTRGIIWNNEFTAQAGINKNSKSITKLTSDMEVYASLTDARKVMAVIRLGGGHIFSNSYEYFQALTLGANNFLRGYRKNRFSGTSLAYGSTELRVKLFDSKWYILPGDIGVTGFYDIGRVWMKNENSKQWHQSYGGGFYFAPFNFIIVSANVGISKEDVIFNFSLGTKFNITF